MIIATEGACPGGHGNQKETVPDASWRKLNDKGLENEERLVKRRGLANASAPRAEGSFALHAAWFGR